MLVKDLDGIMFETQTVSITVFDNGKSIDEASRISWSYAKRIYGDLEVTSMFSINHRDRAAIALYTSFPESEKKLSPELQRIMECYEEFSEFIDDCGMRALL